MACNDRLSLHKLITHTPVKSSVMGGKGGGRHEG